MSSMVTITVYVPREAYVCTPPAAKPPPAAAGTVVNPLVGMVEVELSPQEMVPLYWERFPAGSASLKVTPAAARRSLVAPAAMWVIWRAASADHVMTTSPLPFASGEPTPSA